jgi:hypothetical protein
MAMQIDKHESMRERIDLWHFDISCVIVVITQHLCVHAHYVRVAAHFSRARESRVAYYLFMILHCQVRQSICNSAINLSLSPSLAPVLTFLLRLHPMNEKESLFITLLCAVGYKKRENCRSFVSIM